MANQLIKQEPFSVQMNNPKVIQSLQNALSNPKRVEKIKETLIIMAANNPDLAKCNAADVVRVAINAENLNLSLVPELGQSYIVVRNKNSKDANGNWVKEKKPAFQIGYKGLRNLAIRSGIYKRIHYSDVKQGELIGYNPIKGEYKFSAIIDPVERELAPTIGYYAYYETKDGTVGEEYWHKSAVEMHAARYSEAYKYDKKNGKSASPWSTNFDQMATKTVLISLLKQAPLSPDMRDALESEEEAYEAPDTQPEQLPQQPDTTVEPPTYYVEAEPEDLDLNEI